MLSLGNQGVRRNTFILYQGNHRQSAYCVQRPRSHLGETSTPGMKTCSKGVLGPLKLSSITSYESCHLVILIFQAQADCQVNTKTGLTTDSPYCNITKSCALPLSFALKQQCSPKPSSFTLESVPTGSTHRIAISITLFGHTNRPCGQLAKSKQREGRKGKS